MKILKLIISKDILAENYWWLYYSNLEIRYLYLENRYYSISTLPQVLTLLELEKEKTLSIKALAQNLNCNKDIIKKDLNDND